MFLSDVKIGRTLDSKPKITNFFGESNSSSKEEKINNIIQFTCPESIEQLCLEYLKKKAKESNQNKVSLKSLHGGPLIVNLGWIRVSEFT